MNAETATCRPAEPPLRHSKGAQSLGQHSDREEIDSVLQELRAWPIASISLGVPLRFGFRRNER